MKNLSRFLLLFIMAVLVSCSSNDEMLISDNQPSNMYESATLSKLSAINDSVALIKGGHQSRGILKGFFLITADFTGAYSMGKIGSALGGAIGGAATAGPGAVPGAAIGGTIGAAIGGIGASYGAYLTSKGCAIIHVPSIENSQMAYCSAKEDVKKLSYIGVLDIPDETDSIEMIGIIHNEAMDVLIKANQIMPASRGPIWDSSDAPTFSDSSLSAFESSVLSSEKYVTEYNKVIAANSDFAVLIDPDRLTANAVAQLYKDALQNYDNASFEDIVSLTNQYISIVDESNEISKEDKRNLYIAFSVAIYSYKYWSNYE